LQLGESKSHETQKNFCLCSGFSFYGIHHYSSPCISRRFGKNIDENQKIIYNKTNKKLTKSNGTCEKVYSDSTDEENAAEADTPDSEDSETEAAKATYDDDEIDEEIETPNKQIKELKDKIKVLR